MSEVSARKILILSASPSRDKLIDELIADELRSMGNQVWVHPCLREGRDAVLKLQPNVVVLPPIRNLYSRDMAEQLKMWGCGVVSRHTEPSCDWQDWKRANAKQRQEIMGAFAYYVDHELVWSEDEAQILRQRKSPFQITAVGAIGLDTYKNESLRARLTNRPAFNEKWKFTKDKTLIISSPWGFADSAPDLHISDLDAAKRDLEGRDRHIAMIRQVVMYLSETWNILLTTHAGVMTEPYAAVAKELNVPYDSTTPMMGMLPNCDALIHAGSTAAINAHSLNIPTFQFGDVNAKTSDSWWGMPESTISKVAPYFSAALEMAKAIAACPGGSNADPAMIDNLEKGRYGSMDGQAYRRAAAIINSVHGEFKYCWPMSHNDYDQLRYMKSVNAIATQYFCGICKTPFYAVTDGWIDRARKELILTPPQYDILKKGSTLCPQCGAQFIKADT